MVSVLLNQADEKNILAIRDQTVGPQNGATYHICNIGQLEDLAYHSDGLHRRCTYLYESRPLVLVQNHCHELVCEDLPYEP